MLYKGCKSSIISKDEETGILSGIIDNIPDYVAFQGNTMFELEQSFKRAVDTYLEECKAVGKELSI
jgi:predicted HicB family RNase H-like nuclease